LAAVQKDVNLIPRIKFFLKNTVDNPQNKICNAYITPDVYAGMQN
jgi:hypothetical protein